MCNEVPPGFSLHTFSEALAIGQAAKAGELSRAVLLINEFALHNANEGFASSGRWRGRGAAELGLAGAGRPAAVQAAGPATAGMVAEVGSAAWPRNGRPKAASTERSRA